MWTKLINLILYSNLWIALAAAAMVWQTEYLLLGRCAWSAYLGFIFAATLCLYAMHRLIGISKVKAFRDKGRFQVIWEYRSHIAIYAALAALAAAGFIFLLPWRLWLYLLFPCALSLAYVLPAFGEGRRLRDLAYIKIFVVAISWSWLTVVIPLLYHGMWPSVPAIIMTLERACFIFAITIPFDIRDLRVDAHTQVRTLPGRFGIAAAKAMAYGLLGLMLLAVAANLWLDAYTTTQALSLTLSALFSACCVYFSDQMQEDYFFTGLVDGMMIVQFGLLVIFS